MLTSIFPLIYGAAVLILLWQAFRVIAKGVKTSQANAQNKLSKHDSNEDRTGRLTIHPELLDQEGRITNEELLTVRFSGDIDPPQSAETSPE